MAKDFKMKIVLTNSKIRISKKLKTLFIPYRRGGIPIVSQIERLDVDLSIGPLTINDCCSMTSDDPRGVSMLFYLAPCRLRYSYLDQIYFKEFNFGQKSQDAKN
ncbi:hypothetical protein HELRODRAFT_164128 [Helobdella robusta]|uniref:Uncharacterized protein n=1 Tax=Helobdella robusta TaxID=6412 RepID=T1EUZ2_HELRO|nr:hypothetical protein HELRODRAFT_164128 [Helobdella robusta]ESN94312.1 hypothetical protein HELRODRAFT_164128 [Helobdella robusta]